MEEEEEGVLQQRGWSAASIAAALISLRLLLLLLLLLLAWTSVLPSCQPDFFVCLDCRFFFPPRKGLSKSEVKEVKRRARISLGTNISNFRAKISNELSF
jgi:hypothetical protein